MKGVINMNYAIMRFCKYHMLKEVNNAISHCRREFPIPTLSHPEAKNVNIYTRTMLAKNYDKRSFEEVLNERLNGNKIKKNNVICVEYVMSFTPNAIKEEKHADWAKASVKWLKNIYGEENLYQIFAHRDESNFHLHAFIIPERENRLCFKKFVDGPVACRDHQDSYYEAVKEFGLDRGLSVSVSKKQHESHKRWMAEHAEKEAKLNAYEKTFGNILDWDIDTVQAYYQHYDKIKKEERKREEQQLYSKIAEAQNYTVC